MSGNDNSTIFCNLADQLRFDGGTGDLAQNFPDQELVDELLCVMDFYYDSRADFMTKLLDIIWAADKTGRPVEEVLHQWLDPIMAKIADAIEDAYNIETPH